MFPLTCGSATLELCFVLEPYSVVYFTTIISDMDEPFELHWKHVNGRTARSACEMWCGFRVMRYIVEL